MFAWVWRRKSAAQIEQALLGAIAHHDAGRLEQAEAGYREVLAAEPRHVDALHFLGYLEFQRGAHERAADLIARSLAINPKNVRAQLNLGNVWQARGEQGSAAACFRKALALEPRLVEARFNLGVACRELGQRDEAAECFAEAIRQHPGLAEAHYALGHLHCDEDRLPQAVQCFREALRLRPDYAEARWSAAMAHVPQVYGIGEDPSRCRAALAAGLEELERWLEQRPAQGVGAVGTVQPFSLAYDETPNRELLERHGRICTRLMGEWQRAQGLAPAVRGVRSGAMRVGVVSAQFRHHSVWHAIVKGWFQQLDRERFALHAFSLHADDDAQTRLAASHAAHFAAGPRSVRDWAGEIQRQRPDILIYPEIGMDPTALKLAAMRLAPVQAASWGHPETSGLQSLDYYLSAEDLEPPGAQANYSERLVALPHLGCYVEPRVDDDPRPTLGELGLDARRPILVCPGVPFKYAPQYDWIFPELAQRLGECRFVFFTHATRGLTERLRTRLERAFAGRGLDAGRFVLFLPWLTNAAFQALMSQAHVYLDTIGFSGFNSALQAVSCGLPVVTREGRFMRGRLASGILKRMGIPELVAGSEHDYVALAERVVRDPAYRDEMVRRIRAAAPGLYRDRAPIEGLERFLAGV